MVYVYVYKKSLEGEDFKRSFFGINVIETHSECRQKHKKYCLFYVPLDVLGQPIDLQVRTSRSRKGGGSSVTVSVTTLTTVEDKSVYLSIRVYSRL